MTPEAPDTPPTAKLSRVIERLIRVQLAHPFVVLAAAGLVTVVCLVLATHLELNTGFEALLPDSRPSVIELHRVEQKTSSLSTIFVVLEGDDPVALRHASDALVPALTALGPPWVSEVADGVHASVDFLEPRAGLFTDLPKLQKLHDDIEARYAYEVQKADGTLIDLDGLDAAPPPLDIAKIRQDLSPNSDDVQRFPGGYYQSADGKTQVIAIRCGIPGTDTTRAAQALAKVQAVVDRVNPKSFDPGAHWGLSGDLAIGLSEYKLVSRDLTSIGIEGALLILGVVLLYYLRLRMVVAMGLTIGIGLAWTFGLTEILLGHLNLATGFLFTIVGGNGINFSIIYMARFLEERRRGVAASEAMVTSARATWLPTLTAAAAASASYGALIVTEFRGFKEFGIIGGFGMLICWVATFIALPPILIAMERIVPLVGTPPKFFIKLVHVTAEGVPFGRPFAVIAGRVPGFVVIVTAVLAVAGAIETVAYIRSDPMEYDTNKIQSDRSSVAEVHRLIHIGIQLTGYVGLDSMALVTDRLDQVAPLKAALEARRDAAPADAKPFKAVHTLEEFVPPDQAAKIPLLEQIKQRVEKLHRLGKISPADWDEFSRYLPPDDLKPFGMADLPEAVARPFTERDGTRGRVVFITPLGGDVTSDAHYLIRWADSFRRTVLPDGSVILGSGRAVIFADMWAAVVSDIPKAVAFSFAATVLIIALAFRRGRATLAVIFSLVVGVCLMGGALSLFRVKLNFLNFIALPVTFGIGVDYAVNVVQRDLELGDPLEVLRRTGGAVILCSLTTLLGYLVLVRSVNFGVRSLGVAAVSGEVSCLLVAVLALPAALVWFRPFAVLKAPAKS